VVAGVLAHEVSFLRRRKGVVAPTDPVELAALADGTADAREAAIVAARVAESPELAELLAEQRSALTQTRNAAAAVDAPDALRRQIDERRAHAARARRRPRRVVLGGAVVVAAAALALVLAIGSSRSRPTQFQAALAATKLAPRASGEATLTKTASGWRIELRASGLPRLDGGRFYEAWLASAQGVRVPVGTFNDGRKVTLWAGVSPATFGTLSVTRERADDVQASSGEKVLVGTAALRS
jgi:hypothetical protein